MKKNYSSISSMLVCALVCFQLTLKAQCVGSFTGLLPNYCVNSPGSVLTPSLSGGTFQGPGISGTSFSPSIAGPGTHTISYGFCTSAYSITISGTSTPLPGAVTFSPYVFSSSEATTNVVSLSDDQLSGLIPIGFPFTFFCATYTACYISSNGFVTFNPNAGNGCCSGGNMPTNATPDNLIASAWTDLNPAQGGTINYITVGTTPTRTMIISYTGVVHFSGSCCPVTQQIKIFETSNNIEIHTTTKPINTNGGVVTTMGIQNSGGTIAYPVAGRNANSTWTASNEAVRFTPVLNCLTTATTQVSPTTLSVTGSNSICTGSSTTLTATGNTTYTWTGGASSNASSVVVNPTSTTAYSISGTNGFGCTANAVVNVTVFSGLPTLSITSSTTSVCLGQSATLTANGAVGYSWSGGITNGAGFTPSATTNYIVTGTNSCGSGTSAITITVAPLFVSAIANPTTVCAGSTATLNAASAASQFTWSPTNGTGQSVIVSPSVTTIFTVTASNGTCLGTTTITLNTVPIPTITSTASATNICQGGSVVLSASGGITYTWNPGNVIAATLTVTPSAPTLYAVTANNSFGCTAGSSQVIIVVSSPTVLVSSADPVICSGSSTTLTASGTSNTYLWSSGGVTTTEIVSPNVTTTYSVIGTDTVSLCSTTETVEVNVFTPSITVSGNTVICNGSVASLTANGGNTYTWNPSGATFANVSLTPSVTTNYTLSSLTSTGNINCAQDKIVQVIVNVNPNVTATSARPEICKNESVTLTASGALSYSWNTSATTSSITITSSLITTAFYTVTGTNAQGCSTSIVVQVKVNGCSGINESNASTSKLQVYPNPNNGEFLVRFNGSISLNLTNELGQLIKVIHLDDKNAYSYKFTGLSSGVYFISEETGKGTLSQKIVITN
jgi:hypothetical protein